jgi:hypothetical protein
MPRSYRQLTLMTAAPSSVWVGRDQFENIDNFLTTSMTLP